MKNEIRNVNPFHETIKNKKIVGRRITEVILGFAKSLVPLVKEGTKKRTYRLVQKYAFLQSGDRLIAEDSSAHIPFAEIEIIGVSRMSFSDLPIDCHGHEIYASKSEQREIFERLYKRAVDDTEPVLIIEFKVLKLLPSQ